MGTKGEWHTPTTGAWLKPESANRKRADVAMTLDGDGPRCTLISKGGSSGALLSIEPRETGNFITTNIGVAAQTRLITASDPLTQAVGTPSLDCAKKPLYPSPFTRGDLKQLAATLNNR